MSRGGKLRLTTSVLRVVGVAAVLGCAAWLTLEVGRALQEDPRTMPAAAKTVAVKNLELRTDGVLTTEWLARTLALPKSTSLMELELNSLKPRLLASGQVTFADLTKSFPATLKVEVRERTPVVRVRATLRGVETALLVARDGVVFEGHGYTDKFLEELPWLDGVALKFDGESYLPIADMIAVSDLLSRARIEAPNLYHTWKVISLANYRSDGELRVRTGGGTLVVFAATTDFLPQIAKLDHQWELLASSPVPPAKIDLSLGREVLVAFAPPSLTPATMTAPAVAAPPPAKAVPVTTPTFFPSSPSIPTNL